MSDTVTTPAPPRPERGGRSRRPASRPGAVPRRVSGPVGRAASLAPQAAAAAAQVSAPARGPSRGQTLAASFGAFVVSLPDRPLLDRIIRGRAWILILGLMLGGIVAMQVELLKLNASYGRSIELATALQSRNEMLRADVATATDPNRIERLASGMGMTMPGPEAITFLRADTASAKRAVAGISAPNVAAFEAAVQATDASANLPGESTPASSPASAATGGEQSGAPSPSTP